MVSVTNLFQDCVVLHVKNKDRKNVNHQKMFSCLFCLDVLVEQIAKYKEQFVQAVQEVGQSLILFCTPVMHDVQTCEHF